MSGTGVQMRLLNKSGIGFVQINKRSGLSTTFCQTRLSKHSIPTPSISFNSKSRSSSTSSTQSTDTTTVHHHDWTSSWYPIAFTKDIDPSKPYAFTLLNHPIVIWIDGTGTFRCFRDACPHRLVPLSEGRITTDSQQLSCAYHGWQFNSTGHCTVIPQGGDFSSPRACATVYQCVVKQGLVWVKLQPMNEGGGGKETVPDTSDIPIIAEIEEDTNNEGWFAFGDAHRDLPYDFSTLIENVIDAGHVPFTHHASVSKRESSGSFEDMKVTDRGDWGFTGVWPTGPRKGQLGSQVTSFKPPMMRHTINAFDTKGFANITAVYGIPISPGRSRVIVRQPFRFKNKLIQKLFGITPTWLAHLGAMDILDDDNIFLHLQEQEVIKNNIADKPPGQVYYMPGASDVYVGAFRTWINKQGQGGPFGKMNEEWLAKAGPRKSAEELLDHYHSHTSTCKACRDGLKFVERMQAVTAVVTSLASIVAVAAGLLIMSGSSIHSNNIQLLWKGGAVMAVVTGLAWRWFTKTKARFYKGKYPPPRNVVKGEWVP